MSVGGDQLIEPGQPIAPVATAPAQAFIPLKLPTLQRRVKTWRTERAKEMVVGSLFKSAAMPAKFDEETT